MLDATLHYADQAKQQRVEIVENSRIASQTFRLRFKSPRIAGFIVPGQFIMVRLPDCDDPLIGRAFALYDTVDGPGGNVEYVDFVYLMAGKLTSRLPACRPGQFLDVWGPLGNGFSRVDTDHLIMVAGGIGQTPFLALAKEALGMRRYGQPRRPAGRVGRITLCYGVRTAELLAGVDQFSAAGMEILTCTEDGSCGRRGLVTDLLSELLEQRAGQSATESCQIACCGPEPMMEAVTKIAEAHEVPLEVSLETPMACGIGICFSCVAQVRDEAGEVDYRRTCVEGPVFDGRRIVW